MNGLNHEGSDRLKSPAVQSKREAKQKHLWADSIQRNVVLLFMELSSSWMGLVTFCSAKDCCLYLKKH